MQSRRTKIAAAAAVAAVALSALVGGTLAAFTDADTTDRQVFRAGTVDLDLVEGAGWDANLSRLAIGDTARRTVLLDNLSRLNIAAVRLSAEVIDAPGEFGGRLSEAVTVDITQDRSTVLAADVPLADLADGYDLVFAQGYLPAGSDADLTFDYQVVGAPADQPGDRTQGARESTVNPDNKYQGSALSLTYTVDAIQRAGVDAATSAYAAAVLADNPVGYWRLDDTGTTAADASGNGNHGTYTDTRAFLDGATGDGSVSRMTSGPVVPSSPTLNPTGTAFTLEAWIRFDRSLASSTNMYPIGMIKRPWPSAGYAMHFSRGGGVVFQNFTGSNNLNSLGYSPIPPVGPWLHYVGVRDGDRQYLYLNGVQVATNTVAYPGPVAPSTDALRLGEGIDGAVDDFAVYDHALSPQRVAAHWAAATAP